MIVQNLMVITLETYNMTKAQIKKKEIELEDLYDQLPEGTGILDIVRQIVAIELLLEAECNK